MPPNPASFGFRKTTSSGEKTTTTSAESSTSPSKNHPAAGVVVDVTLSSASSAALIAKDVSEAFSNIPYIKSIAGVIAQLAKMQEEIRLHKRRCNELLEKVFTRSKLVMENLLEIQPLVEEPEFKKLGEMLGSYLILLQQIFGLVTKLTKRGTFMRILDRGLDELNEMDRKVDSYADDILLSNSMAQLQMLMKKLLDVPTPLPINQAYTHVIPPPPVHLVDRLSEKQYLLTTLLASPNAKISILGPGGIGKTALVTSVLNEPDITTAFPQRFFISFDGLTTAKAVYTAFASNLGIKPGSDQSDTELLSSILEMLKKEPTLLCLDNFETFWEGETRTSAEEVLKYLASLPNVAIVLTIRGTQRPRGLNWTKPHMEPLKPLSKIGAQDLLVQIAGSEVQDGENAEYANKLLDAVEGLPLAVTIISYLLQDGNETPQTLWERWCEEHTRMIEDVGGAEDRLSKLDVSIELSLNSARMKANPQASLVLAALAILPDGISSSGGWIEGLQKILGAAVVPTSSATATDAERDEAMVTNLRRCITTLLDVSLLTNDKSTTPSRLRLLSPIRQYCLRNLPPRIQLEDAVIELWGNVSAESTYKNQSEVHERMIPEVNNIRSILDRAFTTLRTQECSKQKLKSLTLSAIVYTNWTLYLGTSVVDVEILNKAIELCTKYRPPPPEYTVPKSPPPASATTEEKVETLTYHLQMKADCLQVLGKVYIAMTQYQDAIKITLQAKDIHNEIKNLSNEAQDLVDLGLAYTKLEKWEEAQEVLEAAVDLHREAGDEYGEGYALRSVGELCINRGPEYLEKAESRLEQALEIHKRLKEVTHEATDIGLLARVYEDRGKLVDAERMLLSAVELSRSAGSEDKLGTTGTMLRCGVFYMRLGRWQDSLKWYRQAITLAEEVNYPGLDLLKGLLGNLEAMDTQTGSDPIQGRGEQS